MRSLVNLHLDIRANFMLQLAKMQNILSYTKVWTIPMACELSFQRVVYFSAGCTPHRTLGKIPHSSGVLYL